MIPVPGLYSGTVRHRRFEPKQHEFTYNVFMAWLDIDTIPEVMAQTRWTSYNHFNWAAFDERDHFGDPADSLRARVAGDAARQGVPLPDGPIYLLTNLRYLGYCFNPISLYFCYDSGGELGTVLAEVNSTFGESHNYWLWSGNRQPSGKAFHYICGKSLHVSPFMSMDLDYEFVLTKPAGGLVAHINTLDRKPGVRPAFFDATLSLRHEPWTKRNIRAALLRYPWMTARVIGAIHWEALKLFAKRVPFFRHPAVSDPAPEEALRRK